MNVRKKLCLFLATLLLIGSIPGIGLARGEQDPDYSQLDAQLAQLAEQKKPVNKEKTVFLRWDAKTHDYVIEGKGKMISQREANDSPDTRDYWLGTAFQTLQGELIQAIQEYFTPLLEPFWDGTTEDEEQEKEINAKQNEYLQAIGVLGYDEEYQEIEPNTRLVVESGVSFPDDAGYLFSQDTIPNLEKITFPKDLNTSNVVYMDYMFRNQKYVNPDVASWDTSHVQDMNGMFWGTESADPDVSKWNTSDVRAVDFMFYQAKIANPDVSRWDTSNVGNLDGVEEIHARNLSKGSMQQVFAETEKANPDVSNWKLPYIKSMMGVFANAKSADPDVSKWAIDPVEFAENNFWDSGAKEIDLRTWNFHKDDSYKTAGIFNETPKLQYIYLPKDYTTGGDSSKEVMASDFKMQKDGEKASEILPGSHTEYDFVDTGVNTLYFVPQNLKVKVAWEGEDLPETTRPKEEDITLLANGKTLDQFDTMTQIDGQKIQLNNGNDWTGEYQGLDIFHAGEKIRYSVKQAPIDDYITVFEPESVVTPNKHKTSEYDLVVRNIYKTIIEQTDPDKKPLTPPNFVKVTVDTTNKATDASKFQRIFWVTPNREVTLPVGTPEGKTLDARSRYVFESWQEEKDGGRKWAKGNELKGTFKGETTIVANYSEKKDPLTLAPVQNAPEKDALRHETYIQGYPDQTIRPDQSITRAETAAMIARLEKLDQSNTGKISFADGIDGAWYNGAVNSLVAKKVLEGYPDGSFKAENKITRAEFAKVVSELGDKAKGNGTLPFADAKGHWAETFIQEAYLRHLITGYPDGSFQPNQAITRAEVARILNKLYDRQADEKSFAAVKEKVNHFSDLNKNHWAYYELVEASNNHDFVRREKGSMVEDWLRIAN
ncbi:MAG: S-layer homology domain-containing protein [Peptoniphilus sp.]|nr:S-layer homology domain-containing protein [Peptoniphilus sp.]MDY3118538.1 S-layer homology domain-containing protein [Peptoniphilus sp.]